MNVYTRMIGILKKETPLRTGTVTAVSGSRVTVQTEDAAIAIDAENTIGAAVNDKVLVEDGATKAFAAYVYDNQVYYV